jgi:hypothetical protein
MLDYRDATSESNGTRVHMMRDLTSKGLIVAKGLVFLTLAGVTATLLLLEAPSLRVAALIVVLVWASCRFYYFLFYVLQHYVDPNLRYAGLRALLGQIRRARRAR